MRFTAEVRDKNRITIPAVVYQGLALRRGDFLEVTVEIIKRVTK
jgi:bifunctional DNA-binding transcriptional regulator/antitoxin component of YhaV-PrlF toxin-antitoxin module